jgi:hypothetical protein
MTPRHADNYEQLCVYMVSNAKQGIYTAGKNMLLVGETDPSSSSSSLEYFVLTLLECCIEWRPTVVARNYLVGILFPQLPPRTS